MEPSHFFNYTYSIIIYNILPAIPVKAPRAELQVWVAKTNKNKATRSPEISRQQVQKLTPQLLFFYIYIGYRFPLSLSTIVFLNKNIFCFLFPELFFLEMLEIVKNARKILPPPPPGGLLPIFSIYIFSIYICAARMPLFLAIFLSLAT